MSFVEVCGLLLSGTHVPAGGLIYSKLTGWDGQSDARGEGDAIPSAHGSFARTRVHRSSRAISVTAGIIASSQDEFLTVKRHVEAMPAIGEMRVDHGDGAWSREVEVDQITIPDWHGRDFVEFTIDLLAPDPVRYRDPVVLGPVGAPSQVGGLFLPAAFPWDLGVTDRAVLSVVNEGAVPLLPVVTVTGSASSIVVHGGPRRVEFGAFNGALVVDSLQRRVFLSGTDVTRQVIRRDWHEVPPGGAQDFFFEAVSPSPDISLTVEYRIGAW